MKVYFCASQKGKKYFSEKYSKIYHFIEDLGHQHIDDDIISVSEQDYYARLNQGGKKSEEKLYDKKIKSIQEADVCIFEVSISSNAMGFQIRKSLELNKPTVLLYFGDNIPHLLIGVKEDKLLVENYSNNNLKQLIKDIFNKVAKMRDKRFNFYVSTDLINYLEDVSRQMSITKSTFIRNLIIEHKQKKK